MQNSIEDFNDYCENLTDDQAQLLSVFLHEWQYQDRTVLDSLTQHELDSFLAILRNLKDNSKLDLDLLYELDYIERPVSPEEFLQHDYYYGKQYHTLYPPWRKEIPFVLDAKNEIKEFIISGAIGTGKSNTACLLLAYKTYYLTCLRDPHSFFPGINKGSKIGIGLFNTTLAKTGQSIYADFKKVMNNIPYFKDKFKTQKRKHEGVEEEEIILPKHITVIAGSNESHALSLNMFSAVLDEQNFREGKRIPKYEESRAFQLYSTVASRIDSRFRSAPTLLITISSANTMSDFMVEHIDRQQKDPHTHVARYSQWEAKPWDFPSNKFFKVAIGDDKTASAILKENEVPPENIKVIEIPEELHSLFEINIDGNLRDLAGIDTVGQSALIHDKSKITEAANKGTLAGLSHPFSITDIVLDIRTDTQIKDIFQPAKLLMEAGKGYRLIRHPFAHRYLHVDLAESGDSAAISMAHISEVKSAIKIDTITSSQAEAFMPIIEIDFMLRIRPPVGSKIDFDKILAFIFYLKKELGIEIGRVTYDGYQSHHSIQILEKNGYNAKVVSLDRTDIPYVMLQQTIATGRLISYPYEPFESEIKYLVHNIKTRKVDHLKAKKKDTSDSICGAVFGCYEEGQKQKHSAFMPPELAKDNKPQNWAISDYKIPEGKQLVNILKRK